MRYSDGVHSKGRGFGTFEAVFLAVLVLTIVAAPCSAVRWSEFIDEGNDRGVDLAAVTGGGTIGAGSTDGDAWLVRFEDDGTVIWEYTYPVGDPSIFRGVIENSTGFCAIGDATIGGDLELYAVCVNTSGTVLWQNTYEGEDDDAGMDLAELGDEIVLVGWTESFDNGSDRDAWGIVVDESDGTVKSRWVTQIQRYLDMEYRFGGTGDEQFNTIVVTDEASDEFVVAGSTTSYGPGGEDVWVFLTTTLIVSPPSWYAAYGGSGGDERADGSAFYDGDVYLAGREDSLGPANTGVNMWLMKIDESDGTIDWEYSYNTAQSVEEVAYDLHYDTSATTLYVAGWGEADDTAHVDRTSQDMLLLSVDPSDGSLNWSQFYDSDPGSDYTDTGTSVTEDAGDGDIYFGGEQVLSESDRDWWVLKLDSSGDVDPCGTEGVCWFNSAGLDKDSTSAGSEITQVAASQTSADVEDKMTSRSSTSLSRTVVCP